MPCFFSHAWRGVPRHARELGIPQHALEGRVRRALGRRGSLRQGTVSSPGWRLAVAAVVAGTVGVSQAHGVGLANTREAGGAAPGAPIPAISLGGGVPGAMPAAMLFSAVALGVCKVGSLVRHGGFTPGGDAGYGIGDAVPGRFARMPNEGMEAMRKSRINAMRGLQENGPFIAKFAMPGQRSPFAGTLAAAMPAVPLIARVISPVALAWAQPGQGACVAARRAHGLPWPGLPGGETRHFRVAGRTLAWRRRGQGLTASRAARRA